MMYRVGSCVHSRLVPVHTKVSSGSVSPWPSQRSVAISDCNRFTAPVRAISLPEISTSDPFQQYDQTLTKKRETTTRLITKQELLDVERTLLDGHGIKALIRFNEALRRLDNSNWGPKLKEVFREWCFNLESFNPAFAAVLLQVQLSIGESDYHCRDNCLRNLIQPLAGEYGMHNNEPQAKTHRQLFEDFYKSIFQEDELSTLFSPEPIFAKTLFEKMIRDIQTHGNNSVERASYALGYNLAIEFLADYEKRWMLHSFRSLDSRLWSQPIDWVFLEIHAEDEKEHAAIGHEAVLSFVPRKHLGMLQKAVADHDRDFAEFYKQLTALLC